MEVNTVKVLLWGKGIGYLSCKSEEITLEDLGVVGRNNDIYDSKILVMH